MKIKVSQLRKLIREVMMKTYVEQNFMINKHESAGKPIVLYHGTLHDRVPSILSSGLRAGSGWGGAASPGVFLSPSREDAEYWGTASLLKQLSLPVPRGGDRSPTGTEGDVVVLTITVPHEESGNIVPRRKSFSLPGDVQFVGNIPPEWISADPS